MSNNIWGYQGLQTPLENLTRGNYNVADYTNMRKEFGARIQALENSGGFQPTNITMYGYLDLIPGSAGNGDLSVAGTSVMNGSLTVGGNVVCSSDLTVSGTLNAPTVFVAPQITYFAAVPPTQQNLNLNSQDNYFIFYNGSYASFYFTGFVVGQKITFVRDVEDLLTSITLYSDGPSLAYRVLFLDGTIALLNHSGSAGLQYSYAGQQKLRNTFLVTASGVPATYAFDLVEIS